MSYTLASGSENFELSTGQFAKFFQIFELSNARRLLRRIHSNGEITYEGYRVRVEERNGKYVAILSPSLEKTITVPTINTKPSVSSLNSSNDSFQAPFCDWLTIHQNYDYSLPQVNSGCVVSLNSIPQNDSGHYEFGGEDIEFLTTRFMSHEGSYKTNLQLRVDGNKMTLSGNVGRFGRPDNLFGFSVSDCVKKANRILDSLNIGLPHFTAGEKVSGYVSTPTDSGSYTESVFDEWGKRTKRGLKHKTCWSGAWFSKLHLTRNLVFSSSSEAKLFVDWACRQNPFGMHVSPHFGQGVSYGKGSSYLNPKIYLKGLEIQENKKYKSNERYKEKLLQFIDNKIVRFEIEYKKYLERNGIKYLGGFMEKSNVIYVDFRNRLEVVLGSDIDFFENLEGLSRRRREQFLAWTRGEDFSEYAESTRRLLRKYFREHLNVDISVPYSEDILGVSVRKLSASDLTQVPDFYETSSELDYGFKLVG